MIRPVHFKSIFKGGWLVATLLTLNASAQSDDRQIQSARVVGAMQEAPGQVRISTCPNPVTEMVKVTIPSSWQGKTVTMELISASGAGVVFRQFQRALDTELLPIEIAKRGFYLLRASCEGITSIQRIVKL